MVETVIWMSVIKWEIEIPSSELPKLGYEEVNNDTILHKTELLQNFANIAQTTAREVLHNFLHHTNSLSPL